MTLTLLHNRTRKRSTPRFHAGTIAATGSVSTALHSYEILAGRLRHHAYARLASASLSSSAFTAARQQRRNKEIPMRSFTILAGALLVLAACTERGPGVTEPQTHMPPNVARGPSLDIVSETSTDVWARVITGETGPGSSYQLYLPREWNGTAIFYSHGIRDVLEPVSLRDQDNLAVIRENLGGLGFAVAYSSYSENGYAEKDGAQRTHQLRGLFTSVFGAPTRSLLVGHSLGGLVALDLAEEFSSQYDGVLAVCSRSTTS
jgi:hypothetical protein